VLDTNERQTVALFGDPCFVVSIDRRAVDGFDCAIPVTSASRVVLYRRRGLCWTC